MKKQISVVLCVVTVLCLHTLARGQDDADVRKELEAQYKKLAEAHDRKDLKAILALKTSDFHTFFPDGRIGDSKLWKSIPGIFLNGISHPSSKDLPFRS